MPRRRLPLLLALSLAALAIPPAAGEAVETPVTYFLAGSAGGASTGTLSAEKPGDVPPRTIPLAAEPGEINEESWRKVATFASGPLSEKTSMGGWVRLMLWFNLSLAQAQSGKAALRAVVVFGEAVKVTLQTFRNFPDTASEQEFVLVVQLDTPIVMEKGDTVWMRLYYQGDVAVAVAYGSADTPSRLTLSTSQEYPLRLGPVQGMTGLLVLVAGAIAVGLVLWYTAWSVYPRILHRRRFIINLESLAAGDDIRYAIYRAYREFCRRLEKSGQIREEGTTPSEFRAAVRKAMPGTGKDVELLTALFEEARYSDHFMEDWSADEARRSLDGVVRCLEETERAEKEKRRARKS